MSAPRKCESCKKRRNLRGWRLCDNCTLDWAYANGLDEWEYQMRRDGWAIVPLFFSEIAPELLRTATVAEVRWDEERTRVSPLWDTPLTARQRRRLTWTT